jgi:acyl transferase domain-containing protein
MMSESVYTAQDRANEGCCWDYIRSHCPSGGCLCNCHATNEEILLSDRASLRREVDRERQAFAELTTASVARINQLTADLAASRAAQAAAEQQAEALREELEREQAVSRAFATRLQTIMESGPHPELARKIGLCLDSLRGVTSTAANEQAGLSLSISLLETVRLDLAASPPAAPAVEPDDE